MFRTSFISVSTCRSLIMVAPQPMRYYRRRPPSLLRPGAKPPRATLDTGSTGRDSTGATNIPNGGGGSGPDPGPYGDLYASTPELERIAMKSRDAPVLARVVSYNVLSPPLAKASHFQHCDPAHLNADVRLSRVLAKLEEAVATRAVICLQEVALTWSGPLHEFFASRGFHLVLGTYGSYFNGYFGVALAFPTDTYDATDVRVQTLSETANWPRCPSPSVPESALALAHGALVRAVNFFVNGGVSPRTSRRSRSPWVQSQERRNILIFARLRSRTNGATLCVGTYHMPCAFWSPPIMLIHSALVVQTFQRLCKGDRAVLAGDFNIKPGDSAYRMITTGSISPSNEDYPPKAPDGSPAAKWFPSKFAAMKSAYVQINGKEPDFTNFARTGDAPTFIETLDYLFCSQHLDVVDVMRLPHRDNVEGPLPAAAEPSDHIMIGATLRLPAEAKRQNERRKPRSQSINMP